VFGCILGFLWVLLGSFQWASWVVFCILPVYLGVPYAFLIKFSYLSKKKKKNYACSRTFKTSHEVVCYATWLPELKASHNSYCVYRPSYFSSF